MLVIHIEKFHQIKRTPQKGKHEPDQEQQNT